MGGLELTALMGGPPNFGSELLIERCKFLDGAGGSFRELGDVGGKHIEVVAVADNAGRHDAGIDRNNAHHLDGAAQGNDRMLGGGNNLHELGQVGQLDSKLLGDGPRLQANVGQSCGRLHQLGAFELGRERLENPGDPVENASAFTQAGANTDKGGFDLFTRLGKLLSNFAQRCSRRHCGLGQPGKCSHGHAPGMLALCA